MKKKLIGIFICTLLITTLFPAMSSVEGNEVETLEKNNLYNSCYQRKDWEFVSNQESNNMIRASFGNDDELDQFQESYCGYGWAVWFDAMFAQSFVPTLEILTRIELLAWKRGQPLSLNISIRSDLNDTDLTSINVSEGEISGATQWHEFDFPDINVTPGQTYYIVWDPAGAFDIDNTFCWGFGYNNPYDKGCGFYYGGEGDIWEIWDPPEHPGLDFCFRTYGKPYRPSNPIIDGPTSGKAGNSYPYTFTSTHPKGDNVSYYIEWGDGGTTDWTAFQVSGDPGYSENYTWNTKGTFTIKAKAKDVDGDESEWSELEVTMPMNQQSTHSLFLQFLERFPRVIPVVDFTNTRATLDKSVLDDIKIEDMSCPEIVIASITDGIGVRAVIKNIGDADATNVNWSIIFDGGFILIGGETTGRVMVIPPGENVTIYSGLIAGFGRTMITISAECAEGSSDTKTCIAFIWLIWVLCV